MEIQIEGLILTPEYKTESKGHFKDSWEGNPKTFCFLSGLSLFLRTLHLPSLPPFLSGMNYLAVLLRVTPHPTSISISLCISAGPGVLCCSQGQMQSCDGRLGLQHRGKKEPITNILLHTVSGKAKGEQKATVFSSCRKKCTLNLTKVIS